MKCYSKRNIHFVTLVITLILFVQFNFLYFHLMSYDKKSTIEVKLGKMEETSTKISEVHQEEKEEWLLSIPKIELKAEIKDGTEGEIINSYIGHFKETSYDKGNIGLAAHNEGYKENYFEKLDQLQQGDIIQYQQGETKREYAVITNTVIEETDWRYLRQTSDNRITLITCINNQPTLRRCVQALEIK